MQCYAFIVMAACMQTECKYLILTYYQKYAFSAGWRHVNCNEIKYFIKIDKSEKKRTHMKRLLVNHWQAKIYIAVRESMTRNDSFASGFLACWTNDQLRMSLGGEWTKTHAWPFPRLTFSLKDSLCQILQIQININNTGLPSLAFARAAWHLFLASWIIDNHRQA